ncbi:MAG TPA: hypothetical protein VLG37_05285 [Candidatus Saccharimonadales bacterium]|nr:hypothetical protein [Candidatus Saccharimonadales bacterium]
MRTNHEFGLVTKVAVVGALSGGLLVGAAVAAEAATDHRDVAVVAPAFTPEAPSLESEVITLPHPESAPTPKPKPTDINIKINRGHKPVDRENLAWLVGLSLAIGGLAGDTIGRFKTAEKYTLLNHAAIVGVLAPVAWGYYEGTNLTSKAGAGVFALCALAAFAKTVPNRPRRQGGS